MSADLSQTEKESILTLCLMAAFADGGKSDSELKHSATKERKARRRNLPAWTAET